MGLFALPRPASIARIVAAALAAALLGVAPGAKAEAPTAEKAAPKDAKAEAAAKPDEKPDAPKRPAGAPGGYTYSDGPSRPKHRKSPGKGAGKAAAKASGLRFLRFEMQPGDTGLLSVHAAKVVDVKGQGGAGHWVFHFPAMNVPHRNDRNALHAEGFPTALQSARLHPGKGGTDLIVDLRKATALTGEWRKDAEGDFFAIVLPTADAPADAPDAPRSEKARKDAPKDTPKATKGSKKGAGKKPATKPAAAEAPPKS
jgi:hypothetical protein